MVAKLITGAMLLLFLASLASAQTYDIRTEANTNLRTGPGLDNSRVETAPTGTILQVTGQLGRWLKINRHARELWMANWVRHSRVQSAQSNTAAINNCCFVNRQCHSDSDWVDGYWAFQRNECPVSTPTTQETTTQPVSSTPAAVDNCCFVDRHCTTDQQWTDGYWAYQNGQCFDKSAAGGSASPNASQANNCCHLNWQCQSETDWFAGFQAKQRNQCDPSSPGLGVIIEGSHDFTWRLQAGLNLMREKAPMWYAYSLGGLDKVKQVSEGNGVDVGERVFYWVYHDDNPPHPGHEPTDAAVRAATLVHEAVHVYRYQRGVEAGGLPGESEALQTELRVLRILAPGTYRVTYAANLLANIHKPECQWWTGDYGLSSCELG